MAEEAGDVDALVNNVGDMASSQHSWRELDEATLDHVLDVDIKGTMLMVHEFGVRMLDRGARGAIVNIGSTVIVRGIAARADLRRRQVRPAGHHEVLREGARARTCA